MFKFDNSNRRPNMLCGLSCSLDTETKALTTTHYKLKEESGKLSERRGVEI